MNPSQKTLRPLSPNDICIVAYGRTPIGGLGGSLSSLKAPELGAHVIKHCLTQCVSETKNKNNLSHVEEAFLGNVLSANIGQAPTRIAVIKSGLPDSVICTTVNKVCASGMKSVIFGCQQLQLKHRNNLVLCGGMENMSQVPHYLPDLRFGKKMGDAALVDGMIKDGLWDVYNNFHMGMCAEKISEKMKITREMQDNFAARSFKNAVEAHKKGLFKNEIAPINVKGKVVDKDEGCFKFDEKKFRALKPTGEYAMKHNLTVHAVIAAYDDAELKPIEFTIAPFEAIKKTLNTAKLGVEDIDFWEINEAFAAVSIANSILLKMDQEQVSKKMNVLGGAIALGHPLGCSGARILCTLINVLALNKAKYGCAAICNGGGGASCVVLERVDHSSLNSKL